MEFDRRSVLAGAIVGAGLLGLPSFLDHYFFFISGQVDQVIIQNRWDIVLLNIVGFLLFLIPLNYRRKADWRSMGVYAAFIVSLFIEMYGIPLTVYLSTAAFTPVSSAPNYLFSFSFLGQTFGMSLWMIIGALITTAGMLIVAVGWYTIYQHREGLCTYGIYRYSRHPQYIGIILIAFGWFIGWPTILTTVLLPVLVYTYYSTAKKEEQEAINDFGKEKYEEYRESTPMFL